MGQHRLAGDLRDRFVVAEPTPLPGRQQNGSNRFAHRTARLGELLFSVFLGLSSSFPESSL